MQRIKYPYYKKNVFLGKINLKENWKMDFYTAISRYYNYIFPLNSQQVEFITASLFPGASIIEVGSATGNLTRALAERGYRVVGIDLNESMVQTAKQEDALPNLEYWHMDMLEVDKKFAENSFSGVVCFGNTLVHLPTREKIFDFIKKTAKIIDARGWFFLQIVNYDRILRERIKELPVIENEKIKFERFYTISQAEKSVLFRTRLRVKNQNRVYEQEVKLQALCREELERALKESGFNKNEFFGDFKLTPYSVESPAIVVRAGLGS